MCPLIMNKPELCKAAQSSLMIDMKHCRSEAYVKCVIYAIESQRSHDYGSGGPLQKAEEDQCNLVGVGHYIALPYKLGDQ